jgi:hypothetical protein
MKSFEAGGQKLFGLEWVGRLRDGTAEAVAEKHVVDETCGPGLNPTLILWDLRGAEAPLFHGTARICWFFRSL